MEKWKDTDGSANSTMEIARCPQILPSHLLLSAIAFHCLLGTLVLLVLPTVAPFSDLCTYLMYSTSLPLLSPPNLGFFTLPSQST